jgi:flavin reductase (DIM6/NTAB) family NADH-FMN oxidoreductase RutF
MHISSEAISKLDQRYRAMLINSLTGFKCLQMVGTMNQSGISNLGIFNSIFHLGAHPPLLGMIFRPQSENHDTLKNIKRSGSYTLNNVLEHNYQQAHQTSARYASDCSEFVECGFTELFIADFEAPFVAESSVKLGMELKEIIDIKLNGTTLVIGEIKHIMLNENLVAADGYIDHIKAQTTTVAGLDSYFSTKPLARLAYAKPLEPVKIVDDATN